MQGGPRPPPSGRPGTQGAASSCCCSARPHPAHPGSHRATGSGQAPFLQTRRRRRGQRRRQPRALVSLKTPIALTSPVLGIRNEARAGAVRTADPPGTAGGQRRKARASALAPGTDFPRLRSRSLHHRGRVGPRGGRLPTRHPKEEAPPRTPVGGCLSPLCVT